MNASVNQVLSDRQWAVLHPGSAGILITIGDDGLPTTAFVWTVAASRDALRFATEGSATRSNLEKRAIASLQILGQDNQVFLVKGRTRMAKPRLDALPFESTLMILEIIEVKDQRWPEVHVSPLTYEWSSDRAEEWRATEQAVYKELREWAS